MLDLQVEFATIAHLLDSCVRPERVLQVAKIVSGPSGSAKLFLTNTLASGVSDVLDAYDFPSVLNTPD